MLRSTQPSLWLGFGTQHQCDSLARGDLHTKGPRLVNVIQVRQSTFGITAMSHMPVPVSRWCELCRWPHNKVVNRGTVKSTHTTTIPLVLHEEMPIVCAICCTVIITRETEREQGEPEWGFIIKGAMHDVLHIGCILPILHPDAFVQR